MKIEIKLKDPKYCDECNFLTHGSAFKGYCEFYSKYLKETDFHTFRPIKCIKENGE